MRLIVDSFWRAVAYCMLPRVIVLSLIPLVVMMVVAVAFVVVAVAVELGLFQQPEGQQADQEGEEQVVRIGGAALEGLGQHMQQRSAQQHPG